MKKVYTQTFSISIRAPARGATWTAAKISPVIRFQSALPRGERRKLLHRHCALGYFNPRSREGSDFILLITQKESSNFNPRSREGSDPDDYIIDHDYTDFNPRSREGSDKATAVGDIAEDISIHAPARGAT